VIGRSFFTTPFRRIRVHANFRGIGHKTATSSLCHSGSTDPSGLLDHHDTGPCAGISQGYIVVYCPAALFILNYLDAATWEDLEELFSKTPPD
jgi:hypothetical protein